MRHLLQSIDRMTKPWTGWVLLSGLLGIGAYNLWLWRRDRALAERIRHNHALVPTLSRAPKVSALVAAWNESKHIDRHIQSFLALDYPEIELVLCAGGSDSTLARAERYASDQVLVLEQWPGEGKQHALARCLEHATGEIMYLTDADCLFDPAALVRLIAPIVNDGEWATTGSSRPFDCQIGKLLPTYLWSTDVASNIHNPSYVQGLLGRNAAVARAALVQIGGLDFHAPTGTDYQLARRLCASDVAIRFVSESAVPSEYPESLAVYRHKQSRWLRNLLLYGWRYKAWSDVRMTLRTVLTGILMLLAPFASLAFGSTVFVPWLLLVAHALLSKLRYMLFATCIHHLALSGRMVVSIVPLTFFDFLVWALPIFDILHPKRRQQW